MDSRIRGIECALEEDEIETFLRFIAEKYSSFVIPWCMLNGGQFSAKNTYDMLPPIRLKMLAQEAILELVLFAYAPNALPSQITSYSEFVKSECSVCLIYYDCGTLEIYIKNRKDFNEIWDTLLLLHAQDMVIKTDASDGRSKLCL